MAPSSDVDVHLRFPAERGPFDALFGMPKENSDATAMRSLLRSLQAAQPAIREFKRSTGIDQPQGLVLDGSYKFDN